MQTPPLLDPFLNPLRRLKAHWELPALAKAEKRRDKQGLSERDPGADAVVNAGIAWLYRAQDCSPEKDGGCARHYSLLDGWGHSYPETTGYIVPTLLDWGTRTGNSEAFDRARRMLEWFKTIQLPGGGFQGGTIEVERRVPVTFNTGQILLGLAAGVAQFGDEYVPATRAAAGWLRDTQDADGAWRRHPTPFAEYGEKTYETHVAWGLFEAERVLPGEGFAEAGTRNLDWALTKQQPNGWLADCCLDDPPHPLTHTLGYAVRGFLEGYRFQRHSRWLEAAQQAADGIRPAVHTDGYLAGRLDEHWRPAVPWACLTGSSQLAICLMMLAQYTGDQAYLKAARALNSYVRRTIATENAGNTTGGVKGSFPVHGDYGQFQYLNWATKFTVDANLMEADIADS